MPYPLKYFSVYIVNLSYLIILYYSVNVNYFVNTINIKIRAYLVI